jgi:flagellar protein FliS
MNGHDRELTYRKMTVENASPAGLVVILYDVLVGDLSKTIEAIDTRNIEKRAEHLKHALLVLQQLEGSLDLERGGETARSLVEFYSYLRSKMMEAHVRASADVLHCLIELVLNVREAWQQIDTPPVGADGTQSATWSA